jgi:hypothetical protein
MESMNVALIPVSEVLERLTSILQEAEHGKIDRRPFDKWRAELKELLKEEKCKEPLTLKYRTRFLHQKKLNRP